MSTPMRHSTTAGARCLSCDRHVSAQFARTFGDNQDRVHACPNCETGRALHGGAAGRSDR